MGKISIRKQDAIDYIKTSNHLSKIQVVDFLRRALGYTYNSANNLYKTHHIKPTGKNGETLRERLERLERLEARDIKRVTEVKRPMIKIDLTNYFK